MKGKVKNQRERMIEKRKAMFDEKDRRACVQVSARLKSQHTVV